MELWDADPDVCCKYFQLGACEHTEGGIYEEQNEQLVCEFWPDFDWKPEEEEDDDCPF